MLILLSMIVALVLTLFSGTLLRSLALRIGLVDAPGGRKHHLGHIPLVGGIAMFIGFMFALLVLPISLSEYRPFLAACALLVIVGVLDDFHELSTRQRFIAQVIAAVFMIGWGHVYIHHLGNLLFWGDINLRYWAFPFTIICVVGMINAVNMTDGLDGLAGGLAFIELLLLAFLAVHAHLTTVVYILILLLSALVGFLYFNLSRVKQPQAIIFMGDAGSMLLGFALVWFLINLSQGQSPAGKPVTMLWIMMIPLFDMASVMLRRLLRGQSPFAPDRQHIHHLLQRLGYSSRQVTQILCLLALTMGIVGIIADFKGVSESKMFSIFLGLFMIYFYKVTRYPFSYILHKSFHMENDRGK